MLKTSRLTLLLIASLNLLGCQDNTQDKIMEKPTSVHLTFDEPFGDFEARYPAVKIQRQPAGANFYKLRWSVKNAVTFQFKQEGHDLEFDHVIGMMLVQNAATPEVGIKEVNFSAGLTGIPNGMNHNEARLKLHAILQGILDKGWKRSQSFSRPRLNGQEAWRYMQTESSIYSLDPTYLPTLEEWRALEKRQGSWNFHIDNKAFMSIKLRHEDDTGDPETAAYLLRIEIVDARNKVMKNINYDRKKTLAEQWYPKIEGLLKRRAEREKELIEAGYTIDETYEDLVINPENWEN